MRIQKFVSLVESSTIEGYDTIQIAQKKDWLKTGKSILKELAKELGLPSGSYEVRVDPAGPDSSGWITDRVPSSMRDVFLDLDLDGGVVVIGFWDDPDKCWRITGTNCVIEDPVFGWEEKPVLNLPEVNKAPEWAEITLEKTL